MRHRIAIYGGTDLEPEIAKFVRHLGRAVVGHPDLILVTGGYWYRTEDAKTDSAEVVPAYSKWTSTDRNAVIGAMKFLCTSNQDQSSRVETWLPDARLDRQDVVRFSEGYIRIIPGATAQARRFSLVNGVDAIVAVKGEKNTAQVLDLALAIDKPALPLPFTGATSDAANYWQRYADQIQSWFALTPTERHSLDSVNLGLLDDKSMTELAGRVVEYLRRRIERRCLTLMPFEDDAKSYFEAVLQKSVKEAGFKIVRVDLEPEGGLIYRKFVSHLAGADVVLADLTGYNPNVMYELGHVHANGVTPFLYQRCDRLEDLDDSSIPFYLKGHAIERVVASQPEMNEYLADRLGAYFRAAALTHEPPAILPRAALQNEFSGTHLASAAPAHTNSNEGN